MINVRTNIVLFPSYYLECVFKPDSSSKGSIIFIFASLKLEIEINVIVRNYYLCMSVVKSRAASLWISVKCCLVANSI